VEKAYLVGWASSRRPVVAGRTSDVEEMLQELHELAISAGARVVGSTLQHSPKPDPATLVGRGKVEAVHAAARAAGAGVLIFDHDLTPSQLRNLEQALGLKVIDRTQLILDIFARRARTREGKLQVELAQLNYLLPRLAGRGTLLSRLGGGIGTRGPGEQQLEFDRRRLRSRIAKLTQAIDRVRSQRALHRARRRQQRFLTVSLVGYTNAGKSTLFNTLTRASVTTSPRLFATLDPTVRAFKLESGRPVLLSDTVGFIRKSPPHLVAAFRATLEELEDADLILHVTDASDPRRAEQDAAVEGLLESLGVGAAPRLHVWNKIDLLQPAELKRLDAGSDNEAKCAAVSAITGEGLESLLHLIDRDLSADPVIEVQFELSAADGERLAMLHHLGNVLSTDFEDDRVLVRVRVRASVRDRLQVLFQQGVKAPAER